MYFTSEVGIIGAGISGLIAARQLQAAGLEALVVDKGRGFGGRMATRRFSGATFDHGAQFITVRTPQFLQHMDTFLGAGAAAIWCNGFGGQPDGHPRYIGTQGMTAIPKELGRSLCVLLGRKAAAIRHDRESWTIQMEDGDAIHCRTLILTAPMPQSLALLDAGGVGLQASTRDRLQVIDYDPCLALMALYDKPTRLPAPGGLKVSGEPVAWIADNFQKGITPAVGAVTVHTTPAFARDRWDAPQEETAKILLDAIRPHVSGNLREWQLHRWRYCEPVSTWPARCLAVESPLPLVFAGDAFGGPKVEGAALSGVAAAESALRFAQPGPAADEIHSLHQTAG